MRCTHCNEPVGGILGALHAQGISCNNPDCRARYCSECLPTLATSHDEGFGPFRRAILELRCERCHSVLHRVSFGSALEASFRDLVDTGRTQVQQLLKPGGGLRRRVLERAISGVLRSIQHEPGTATRVESRSQDE